jgi:hypothetical protein
LRGIAEDELIQLGGCVLNLSGLWGGQRQVRNWIDRVAKTKEQLSEKKSLHVIHGEDVARAIISVHRQFSQAKGQRFVCVVKFEKQIHVLINKQMLTDLMVYDWWSLILGFGGELDHENGNDNRAKTQIKWIDELMTDQGVRALPRSMEELGRCYDTREFWTTFGIMPTRSRI